MEHEHTLGAGFDQLLQLVPVARLVLEQCEQEEFSASLLQLIGEHGVSYMCDSHIYEALMLLLSTPTDDQSIVIALRID